MTPEFDRRSSVVLGSPYWDTKHLETDEECLKRMAEFDRVQHAVQVANTYDDLDDDIQELYNLAEGQATVAAEEYRRFAEDDVDGYGRFHEDWSVPEPHDTQAKTQTKSVRRVPKTDLPIK